VPGIVIEEGLEVASGTKVALNLIRYRNVKVVMKMRNLYVIKLVSLSVFPSYAK